MPEGVIICFVDFDGVFEVLGRALAFAKVGQEVCQVDARTKMVVVDSEALFEVLHSFFEVFHLLIAHANVVERIRFWRALVWIFGLDFNRQF